MTAEETKIADLSAALEKETAAHDALKAESELVKIDFSNLNDEYIDLANKHSSSEAEWQRKWEQVRGKLRHQGLEYILNTIPDAPAG